MSNFTKTLSKTTKISFFYFLEYTNTTNIKNVKQIGIINKNTSHFIIICLIYN